MSACEPIEPVYLGHTAIPFDEGYESLFFYA